MTNLGKSNVKGVIDVEGSVLLIKLHSIGFLLPSSCITVA